MISVNRIAQSSTIVAFLAVAWLSVLPSEIAVVDDFNDKAKHVFAFLVLATGLLRYWRISWPIAVLGLLGYGILIEVVQSYVPGRTASAADVLADIAGIALAVLVQFLMKIAKARQFVCADVGLDKVQGKRSIPGDRSIK